ncbi:SusC/RagA family TonB-linked outer membrane protein [Ferruginibacter sp. HRS2-29]|uniref:SusC/RagA family TonB-linked outer membrane protein n=1 Tax=Ferruginibacter sp. HRS2-29 TaxID=2487334 RepID=UPI0020CD0886|nr:SusC/RagA family TonB-linked outer membrane protein [Ferruginibacter sp. HRS2-29]MCP9752631.1 SusC/RagA family TonB-linked outer membrane protein [Ferruginibacter sp. HRS2-29]
MKKTTITKIVTVAMLFILASVSALAQRVVTGKVTNSKDGSAVAGVTVTIKGTKNSVQTNSDGTYRIDAPANARLVFSSVGFTTQESAANDNGSITLVEATNRLEDVVVVAYGIRKKSDLTGSVTSVGVKDFQKGNINSTEQLLVGKVAGLEVTTGGGAAGGGSRIRIRGGASLNASNDPLVVIDGVPVEGNGISGGPNILGTINPDDIESISILKDASATALYGSRASNGVLLVTTKKGRSGKILFNFNTKLSIGHIGDKVDVLTGDQIRAAITADATATGNNTYLNKLGTANTNWQDLIYQDAFGADNNLSASGAFKAGKNSIPFRASLGYLNQEGTLKTNQFDRVSTSLNLNPKFFDDHLAVNIAAKYSHIKNVFADEGAIGSAVNFDPTQAPYDAANKYGGYFQWLNGSGVPINTNGPSIAPNPLDQLYLRDNQSNVNRFIGNAQLDYKLHFLPDLHLLLNMGIDRTIGKGTDRVDSTSVTAYHTKGRYGQYEQRKTNKLFDASVLYAKEISKDFRFDLLAGYTYQTFRTEDVGFYAFTPQGDTIPGTKPAAELFPNEFRLESYLSRINATFFNKYLLTASIRRDASSKFSPENRVGYFPSVALAWKLKEDFFSKVRVMSDLKLRLGYGKTGNQDGIGYYSYLSRYNRSTETAQYQFGSNFYSFLRPSAYVRDLKWETTETYNAGLDFGFLNNRITGSVDVYKKKTSDLLSTVPIAPGANFDISITTNVGNVENNGVEFSINTNPIRSKDFNWDLGFNFTYNKSEITNLLKNPDPNFKGITVGGIAGATGNSINRFAVGYSPYVFYVFKQVYDVAGKPIEGLYEDIDRNGIIDENDKYYYKKPAADVLLGFNTQLTYKKFSLGIAGHGAFGNYVYNNLNSNNGILANVRDPLGIIRNATTDFLETNFKLRNVYSDYYLENASFFRIDNINFGYNFGRIIRNKANLRLSANIQNVHTFTKYTGLDPENSSNLGVDNAIYPRPRIYTIGASLDF